MGCNCCDKKKEPNPLLDDSPFEEDQIYNKIDPKIKQNIDIPLITTNQTIPIYNKEEPIEVKNEPVKPKRQIIGIQFISTDQNVNFITSCKITDIFSDIEKKLYLEYPELKNKNIFFLVNGNIIEKSNTIEKNKINHQNCILIVENEEEAKNIKINPSSLQSITIIHFFTPIGETIDLDIACTLSDNFSTIEKKLYLEHPELKDKNIQFLYNGRVVNRNNTLRENGIENDCTILTYIYDDDFDEY